MVNENDAAAAGKRRVIVTGATGMVGEGVLHECLRHPAVGEVLVVGRKPCGVSDPKLKELVHGDLFDLSGFADRLAGYDACFFALGVSSVGMNEAQYARVTYDLTVYIAELLVRLNPGMVFCYVTGAGTDSSEQGRVMWARVKGRTENALLRMPFRAAYMFRPGFIRPTAGLNNAHAYYRYITWLYPLYRRFFPNHAISLRELGLAMIHAMLEGHDSAVLDCKQIAALARR